MPNAAYLLQRYKNPVFLAHFSFKNIGCVPLGSCIFVLLPSDEAPEGAVTLRRNDLTLIIYDLFNSFVNGIMAIGHPLMALLQHTSEWH